MMVQLNSTLIWYRIKGRYDLNSLFESWQDISWHFEIYLLQKFTYITCWVQAFAPILNLEVACCLIYRAHSSLPCPFFQSSTLTGGGPWSASRAPASGAPWRSSRASTTRSARRPGGSRTWSGSPEGLTLHPSHRRRWCHLAILILSSWQHPLRVQC